MTTYEQLLVGRLTYEEVEKYMSYRRRCSPWCFRLTEDNRMEFIKDQRKEYMKGPSRWLQVVAKGFDKSVLELCYEIKPITAERLNKITIEQWKRWAGKYNIYWCEEYLPYNGNYHVGLSNNQVSIGLLEYSSESIRENDEPTLKNTLVELYGTTDNRVFILLFDLLLLKNVDINCPLFINNTSKTIHDLVWELENL